jgi:molybdate transport system permease protein
MRRETRLRKAGSVYAARLVAIPPYTTVDIDRSVPMIRIAIVAASALLLLFIALPLAALGTHLPPGRFLAALATPGALAALRISAVTTACSLALTVVLGTPLAFALARGRFPGRTIADAVVDLPIVVPPAVAGLALLFVFGRFGLFGPLLGAVHVRVAFTTAAVVLAQLFVGAPFYVRAARAGFAAVDRTVEEASATLGMGPLRTFARITVPLALPALAGGAVLAWARALGEFGATIMVAGNLPGVTQTLPLAVYLGLENGDLDLASALALVLVTVALAVVVVARLLERRAA